MVLAVAVYIFLQLGHSNFYILTHTPISIYVIHLTKLYPDCPKLPQIIFKNNRETMMTSQYMTHSLFLALWCYRKVTVYVLIFSFSTYFNWPGNSMIPIAKWWLFKSQKTKSETQKLHCIFFLLIVHVSLNLKIYFFKDKL